MKPPSTTPPALRPLLAVLLALLGVPGSLEAQTAGEGPVAHAVPAQGPITIDGRMDEEAWRLAPAVTGFTQRDPEEGRPVSQPTEVRILFSAEALYIGARLHDSEPATTRLGRRDMALLDSDWFSVSLDSYHDRRTAFRFQTNPGGVQRDAMITTRPGGENEDLSWDPVWEVATTVDEGGWTVEIRIPFSQLRFRHLDEPTWGLQLERIIGRRGEVAHFAFVPKSEPGGVPSYGLLAGLQDVRPGKRLELLPYVAGRGEYVDVGPNPFRTDREHEFDVGADLMYRLSADLTLNATINPDFGQVEVDGAVVNLGVYEVFFPERRPFFVEGAEIFNFTGNTSGGQLFYSRRIGRAPQLRPPTSAADVRPTTPIIGAAKVSGRTGAGWAVGALNAVTGSVDARFMDEGGEVQRMGVAPLTNHFVARARRDIAGGRSAVGGALTSVARSLDSPELESALHASAWGAGLDFRHEWADRRWQLTGSLAGSHVRGAPAAITATQRQSHHYFQRPDADHLSVDEGATSLSGYSVGASVTRQAGERWRGAVAGALTSPGYEVNDLGFATRTDRRDVQASVTHQQNRPGDFIRDWQVTGLGRHEENFGGEAVLRVLGLEANTRHLNFWSAGLFVRHQLRTFDDRSTRGGPLMIRPAQSVVGLNVGTDPRRSRSLRVQASATSDEFDGYRWEAGAQLQLRPSPRWNLSAGPAFLRGRIPAQYLATVPDPEAEATFGRRYVFAPLEFTNVRADLRLNATIAPRLTLEVYAQPLIFAFDYGDPVSLEAPRTFRFEPFEGGVGDLDTTLRSLVGNAVLRWEWRPGSTLFLAWQQNRRGFGGDGSFSFMDDARGLLRASPDNILVLKATYWLNP
jgi:hypothetical protein